MLLQKPQVRDLNENEVRREDDILTCYGDGAQCANHEFIQRHPKAIRIKLYCVCFRDN